MSSHDAQLDSVTTSSPEFLTSSVPSHYCFPSHACQLVFDEEACGDIMGSHTPSSEASPREGGDGGSRQAIGVLWLL